MAYLLGLRTWFMKNQETLMSGLILEFRATEKQLRFSCGKSEALATNPGLKR